MKRLIRYLMVFWLGLGLSYAYAGIRIPLSLVSGNQTGKPVGVVWADDTIYGLVLTPHLRGLPPGIHGIHVYDLPLCQHHAACVGGHLDPLKTDQHRGPYEGSGHQGDLPVLIVDSRGRATLPLLAPRLTLAQIKGHALIIQKGGDNYSDTPEENGGGGQKLACGAIPYH